MRGAAQRRCHVASFQRYRVDGLFRAHFFVESGAARQSRSCVPVHLQFLGGTDGIPFPRGHYADEIALADDSSAWNIADRTLVNVNYLRSGAVRTLSARANDAPMKHSRHAKMLHVHIFSASFVRDVVPRQTFPDDFVSTRPLQWSVSRKRDAQRLAAHKFAIRDQLFRVVDHRDDTLG